MSFLTAASERSSSGASGASAASFSGASSFSFSFAAALVLLAIHLSPGDARLRTLFWGRPSWDVDHHTAPLPYAGRVERPKGQHRAWCRPDSDLPECHRGRLS